MNIYLASNNKGKIKEISHYFPNSKVLSESDIEKILNTKIDIIEDGKTFEENAKIKVEYIANLLKDTMEHDDIVVADDSGILIPSLPDLLGVYTKRQMKKWCDENKKTEQDFYNYISSICPMPNTCIFKVVIAVFQNGISKTYTDSLKGTLAKSCRGENGFGFDPIFEIENKTLAEMTNEEKAIINPRIKAMDHMKNDILK
ncbi:MAG: non-canonical purine NTP pyrophosphatase [Clostridia bacterium]|nr:non-canonical purine NTP pyrophosphatase [Clostridia bacterium]